jgi:cytochrome c oxidase cbb3-type subunit 2
VNAEIDIRAQVSPDDKSVPAFLARYPKAVARDFTSDGKVTELTAVVAYLQMLGTLVDFKVYDDKANPR